MRLHIRRKRGIRRGSQVYRFQRAIGRQAYPILSLLDLRSRFLKLADHRVQNADAGTLELDVAAGGGGRAEERPGFDAVGHDSMRRAVQTAHAFDGDQIGARPPDARTHRIQAIGKVDHFGLARGVFQHGNALSQGRRHHQVLGAGHRHQVEDDVRAFQAIGARQDIALLDVDLRTECLQALDVQVDGPLADGTTAGQ